MTIPRRFVLLTSSIGTSSITNRKLSGGTIGFLGLQEAWISTDTPRPHPGIAGCSRHTHYLFHIYMRVFSCYFCFIGCCCTYLSVVEVCACMYNCVCAYVGCVPVYKWDACARTDLLTYTLACFHQWLNKHSLTFSVATTIQYGWSDVFYCVTPTSNVSVRSLTYVGDW